MLELMCGNQGVVAALTNKASLNFSGIQINDKILRTPFFPGLLSLLLFLRKYQVKQHAILDRLAQCISVQVKAIEFERSDYTRLVHVTPAYCRAEGSGDLTAKSIMFLLAGYGKLYLYSIRKEQIPFESIRNTF